MLSCRETIFDYMVQPQHDPTPEPLATEVDDLVENAADAPFEQREAQVPAHLHGQRFDKAVVAMAPEFSRSHLQGLIEGGHVRIDGTVATTASRKVRSGQMIALALVPTAESRAFRAETIALDIVHEDADVMVVNKRAGMVVHPAAGNWSGTLLNALLAHQAGAASLPRAGIVHRLDKDTSGLMVVGKTLQAVTALVRAIAAREVSRQYVAIAQGDVRPAEFSVDAPLGRDPQSRIRMAIVVGGKPARTDVAVLERAVGFSLLRCTLHSGRTHQIRVHLASRGYPLVADAVYGGKPALGLARQALHATRLGFAHPRTGERLGFESPMPADMTAAWHEATAPAA